MLLLLNATWVDSNEHRIISLWKIRKRKINQRFFRRAHTNEIAIESNNHIIRLLGIDLRYEDVLD